MMNTLKLHIEIPKMTIMITLALSVLGCDFLKPQIILDNGEGNPDYSIPQNEVSYYTIDQLRTMNKGLSFYGSGGGGAYDDGEAIIDELSKVSPSGIAITDQVYPDSLYIVAGGIGAPSALSSRLEELIGAIQSSIATIENIKNKKITGIVSVESGPVNALLAALISAKTGITMVDLDGAGRSVPQLTNLTYAYEPFDVGPAVLTSANPDEGTVAVFYPNGAAEAEEEIRKVVSEPSFGAIGGLALWSQTGTQINVSSSVRNPFLRAYQLGLLLEHYAADPYGMVRDGVLEQYGYYSFYQGTISSFKTEQKGGFDIGTLTVWVTRDSEEKQSYNIEVKSLNENLLLNTPQGSSITAPTLMSYLIDDGSGNFIPYNNGDNPARYTGKDIYVFVTCAQSVMYQGYDGALYESFLPVLQKVFDYTGALYPKCN